jgi:hypothetical protein
MRPSTLTPAIAAAAMIVTAALALAPAVSDKGAAAQDVNVGASPMMNHAMPDRDQMPRAVGQHGQAMPGMHGHEMANAMPTLAGQDAFGAVQEIVHMLEADPRTDWSKVDLEALRQHLIDMNRVTLEADAASTPVDGGLAIAVTGSDRTLAAIRRMVPAHAHEIDGSNGWTATTAPLPNGVLLTVTSTDPTEAQHIRELGFGGILVSGGHHQPHHLMIAKGEAVHPH